MRRRCVGLSRSPPLRAALLLSLILAPPALAAGWGGSLGAMSDYVFRGVSQSNNQPSLAADVHYYGDAGWFVGLWVAGVRRGAGHPVTAELNAYLGYTRPLDDDWTGRLTYVHYDYPFISPRGVYDYDELLATVDYRQRGFLTVSVSPDTGRESRRGAISGRWALSYDLSWRQPLWAALSADAGIGYYDLRRLFGTGYVYWNAGLGYDRDAWHFHLSYIGTDARARALFYDGVAVRRWVASVVWQF